MIRTVYCTRCGKSGRFPFRLVWEYSKQTCSLDHDHTVDQRYSFCSMGCLTEWVELFKNHNHNWEPFPGFHPKEGTEPIDVLTYCSICHITKKYAPKEK